VPATDRGTDLEVFDEAQTREEWSTGFHSLLATELWRAAAGGLLTTAEADQLAARFLILLDQALDLSSPRAHATAGIPWAPGRALAP
jgi:hypothetical protein